MKRVAKFFLAAGLCVCLLIIPAYAVEAPSGENPANSVLDSMDNSIGSDSSSSASSDSSSSARDVYKRQMSIFPGTSVRWATGCNMYRRQSHGIMPIKNPEKKNLRRS